MPDVTPDAPAETPPIADAPAPSVHDAGAHGERRGLFVLALSALGIVFGDLGTSPLYALQEAFHEGRGVAPTPENVLGLVSLYLWSLVLVVSVKYVAVLMRADNRGEGGILALLALLLGQWRERAPRGSGVLVALGLFGAALLFGDGVITPAISVLSAVEGLRVATPFFAPYVVPITVVLLVGLFAIQPFGSARVGVVFGPILALWFVAIAVLGAMSLAQNPGVLAAVNPLHGVRFFAANGYAGFLALGAVVLCLTGGEALYADMGHFGRRPIRVAWLGLALPSLVLNYLGQGALLMERPEAAHRPFYSLVPEALLYPMVILATLATIVASQALISAVFSLVRQAVQLGYSPRVAVVHTSGSEIGQVYLPALNWTLMVSTVAVVLAFGSSSKLAAAFGLAVAGTMAVTTLLFGAVARGLWRWPWWRVALVAGTFLFIDLAFLAANALKVFDGGWLPLGIGAAVFAIFTTWAGGRSRLAAETQDRGHPLGDFLESLAGSGLHRIRGTGVFLTANPGDAPLVLLHHVKHNQVLHERVVLLSVSTDDVPRVADAERVSVERLEHGFLRVGVCYGFKEEPDVPAALALAFGADGPDRYEPMRTTFYLGRHTVGLAERAQRRGAARPIARWRAALFALLHRNERAASMHFAIPPNRVVELGARVEL